VHKNGILMLDTKQDSSKRRLRPIFMTALATMFGMAPLGGGAGAQLLQPLAIAVLGGITVSMVLSLLITPVLFYQLRRRAL
jgi:multidrug efflux pump subunit AcrB